MKKKMKRVLSLKRGLKVAHKNERRLKGIIKNLGSEGFSVRS